MKDFADLDNSSGSFPDVVGVDCSGPGETDGTELTADYFNQHFGWIQALLNDQGLTPDGNDESDSAGSQILDAIKLLITKKAYQAADWMAAEDATPTPGWRIDSGTNVLRSVQNNGDAILPVTFPIGTIDTEFTIRVDPGAARTGSNRVYVGLFYRTRTGSQTQIGSYVYDDTTTSEQDLVLTNNSIVVVADNTYWLIIKSGNDGATNTDQIKSTVLDISFS